MPSCIHQPTSALGAASLQIHTGSLSLGPRSPWGKRVFGWYLLGQLPGHETYIFTHVPMLGEGNGNPLQYSCVENPMDGEDWQATVHGVPKSRT